MERKQGEEHGRLGKYELLERLGQGGMGEVWKARDTQLQRYVAIKLLRAELQDDPDFLAYFMREARLVAALRHPNIVQIHDFQLAGERESSVQAHMVMDYIEGGTLASAMRETVHKGIFWSANDIVELFTAISLALDYAHGQGMIHRDIKPANILLDQSLSATQVLGTPVLTDFGIARWQGGGSSTLTGFVGTPSYISPEQAQSRPVDTRSDLYSLGIVLYEVLTGITPFRGNNPLGVMLQHVEAQPPLPSLINPLVSPALSAVVLKSIAKDPRDRFVSATAMTIALAQAFSLSVPEVLSNSWKKQAPSADYNPLQPPLARPSLPPVSGNYSNRLTPQVGEAFRLTPVTNLSPSPYAQSSQQSASVLQQAGGIAAQAQAGASYTSIPNKDSLPQLGTDRQKGSFTRKRVLVISLICLMALLLGLGITVGSRFFSASKGTSTPTANGQSVGQLLFLRRASATSGPFNQVQIDLSNVSPPPSGRVYYAWLTQANSEAASVPHWELHVSNGTIHESYTSPSSQIDLFTNSDRLLITTEDAASPPFVPFIDIARHYFYALIDRTSIVSPRFTIYTCPVDNINSKNNPCL